MVCVAQIEESDDTCEGFAQVVGFAIWERYGDSDNAHKWKVDTIVNSLLKLQWEMCGFVEADKIAEFMRLIQMIVIYVQDILILDRSADQSRMKLLVASDLFDSIPERWHL